MTIEDMILKIVDEEEVSYVKEVAGLLKKKFTENEILEAIKRLEGEEKIELNYNIPTHYSFVQYLTNADYNLWLYLVLLASLSTSRARSSFTTLIVFFEKIWSSICL